jgi:hypothetical protein
VAPTASTAHGEATETVNTETIKLIPYAAAKLRITAFPLLESKKSST